MHTATVLLIALVASSCGGGQASDAGLQSEEPLKPASAGENPVLLHDLDRVRTLFLAAIVYPPNLPEADYAGALEAFNRRAAAGAPKGILPLPFCQAKADPIIDALASRDSIWFEQFSGKNGAVTDFIGYDLRPDGPYVHWLSLQQSHNYIEFRYAQNLNISGGIGPTMVSRLIRESEKFDMASPNIQVLYAMHYLTLSSTIRGEGCPEPVRQFHAVPPKY